MNSRRHFQRYYYRNFRSFSKGTFLTQFQYKFPQVTAFLSRPMYHKNGKTLSPNLPDSLPPSSDQRPD